MRALSVCAGAPEVGSKLWIQWTLANRGCARIVSFSGVIDVANADYLVQTLRHVMDAGTKQLIFDLSGVDVIDPAAEQAVRRARQHAARHAVRLDVVCPAGTAGEGPDVYASLAEALSAQSRSVLAGAAAAV